MDKCAYSDRIGCSECNFIFHKQCTKFSKYYKKSLVKELIPFKAKSVDIPSAKVVVARDVDCIKSVTAKYAIANNLVVRRFSLNQILEIMLNKDEDVELNGVVYVECKQKPLGDLEKVNNVLLGFVDRCLMRGIRVFVYCSIYNLGSTDWHRL